MKTIIMADRGGLICGAALVTGAVVAIRSYGKSQYARGRNDLAVLFKAECEKLLAELQAKHEIHDQEGEA